MKLVSLLLIGHVVLVLGSPILKEDSAHAKATTVTKHTPEGTETAASAEASARLSKREEPTPAPPACPKPDYKLVQEKVTLALEKAVEKVMKEQLRKKRATSAKAASEVGPGGQVASSASAKHTPDAPFIPAPVQPHPHVPAEGDNFPHGFFRRPGNVNIASGPGKEGNPEPVPEVPEPTPSEPAVPPSTLAPTTLPPSVPTGTAPPTPAHTHGKVQNVQASADMESGTAIATASKRSADIQNVKASGNKAIASAKNNPKNENGVSIQKVAAVGGEFASASAVSGNDSEGTAPSALPLPAGRSEREATENHQNVKASGNSAIASAKNHKAGDINTQNVEAIGGKLAVATASDDSGSGVPETAPLPKTDSVPLPGQGLPGLPGLPAPATHNIARRATDTTIQVVKASGDKAISSASSDSHGVSTFQDVESHGKTLAVATATDKSRRSACDLPFDDSLKSLISKAVADTFKELNL